MSNIILEKIDFYCDMVLKGKPCACEAIQDRYVSEVINKINNLKLKSYIEELSTGWKTIWIYKDEYIIEIIKELPEEPKTIFEHWILGKVFGYSDEAIRNFIQTKLLYNQLHDT
ncbi:hypothetical protein OD350_03655 [Clostridium beijerinckii]|uniref:hypothetical protein n=1 Tax=Clostridium beijerinckii TaxID=1520 RepID=UPI0022261CCF|nr:hypothetical protein [Clostridium beijerinckii]UYZ36778.1 hypothetical protein OD350_03655 [Clostridium beijerinckii]